MVISLSLDTSVGYIKNPGIKKIRHHPTLELSSIINYRCLSIVGNVTIFGYLYCGL